MIRRIMMGFALVALLTLSSLAIACGDDDDDTDPDPTGDATADATDGATDEPTGDGGNGSGDAAEIEALVEQLLAVDPTVEADVDLFLEHATSEFITYFGFPSIEECRAAAVECIGEPTVTTGFRGTEVSGDEASTTATSEEGDIHVLLINEDDTWKLNGFAFTAEVPQGATAVDVSAVDYGYDWDSDGIAAGQVALSMTNDGDELHEAAVVSVSDTFSIDDVLANPPESEDDLPPGVEDFVGFGLASPGATSNILLELEPGNYALLCFIPDAEGTPHVALGMHSEFTVE